MLIDANATTWGFVVVVIPEQQQKKHFNTQQHKVISPLLLLGEY